MLWAPNQAELVIKTDIPNIGGIVAKSISAKDLKKRPFEFTVGGDIFTVVKTKTGYCFNTPSKKIETLTIQEIRAKIKEHFGRK